MDRDRRPSVRVVLAANVAIGALACWTLYWVSGKDYLLFHTLVEMFSVVIACGIFMVAWNSQEHLDNYSLLFLGIGFLSVAALDVVHALAYKGMNVFARRDADLPTQLWIAGRYVKSMMLLAAPAFLHRRPNPWVVLTGFAAATALLLLSIFAWRIFPHCYVEPTGLTAFKKTSEYAVSVVMAASLALFWRQRRAYEPRVFHLLSAAIVFSIGSELLFSLYASVYGFANMLGHLLRLLSYYLLYKAIIEVGIRHPYDLVYRSLKESEDALRQQTVLLRARNEELDAFSHTVAHDLKGPLNSVIGPARMLERNYGSDALAEDDARELLRIIAESGRKINAIIEDLLVLSELRKKQVFLEPLDMAAVVREVCKRMQFEIAEHHPILLMPPTWPAAVGYAPWVEEMWVNYLGNAFKYGGKPPRVELGGAPQADGRVRFWVRDNGPGLTPDEQIRLFNPFTRLEQGGAKGHGLGLSIVRRIAEKLGGEAGVESQPGRGSVFYFTLPATAPGEDSISPPTDQ
ncbi:MAG: ATP-binding protein [Candidatus Sumerlaeota bacterium]|nr:ATP-binding protein [Candidatus Sumerlaeota bacterium]